MLKHIQRRFPWWRSILWLFVVFEAVIGSGDELRIHQKACTRQRLATNKNSFNFRKLGNGSSLEDCIDYCCRDDTCELAMLSHFHCFGVSCHTPELCHQILDRLLMEDEKQLKRNPRNAGTDFIKHTSQVANPRCPRRFVPSFHVLLLQSGPHMFRVLRKQPMSASQCRADCCGSRDCLLSFIEEGSCYGVFGRNVGRNGTNTKQEASIGLHVAIIDRNKERSRSLDDDGEDDADDDPDDFGSDYADKTLSSENHVHGTLNLLQNATKEERHKMYSNKQTPVGKEVNKTKVTHSSNLQTGHIAEHPSIRFETNKNHSAKERGHITKQTLAGQGTYKTKKTHSPNLQTEHVAKQYSEGFEANTTLKANNQHLQNGRDFKQSSVRFRVNEKLNFHASNLENEHVVKRPLAGFEGNETSNSDNPHPQFGLTTKQTSAGQGVNKSENTPNMQNGHVVTLSSIRKGINKSGNSHISDAHYRHITKQTPVKQEVNRSEKDGTPNVHTGHIVKKSSVRLRVSKTENSHTSDVQSGHMAKQTPAGQGKESNMRNLQYEHIAKETAQGPGVNKVEKNQIRRHSFATSGVSTTVYGSDKVYNYNVKTIKRPSIRKESTLGFHIHHPTTPTTTIHSNPLSTTKLAENHLTKSWQSKTFIKHPPSARKTQNVSKAPIPADKMSSVNHPSDAHKNMARQLNAVPYKSSRKSLKQSDSLKLLSSSTMQNASSARGSTLKAGMDNAARHSNYSSRIPHKSKFSLEDRALKPTMKMREKTIKLERANDMRPPSTKNELDTLRKTTSRNKLTEVVDTEQVQAVKQKAKSSWIKQKVIPVKRWTIPHVVVERRGKVSQKATRKDFAKSPVVLTASSKGLHPERANYSVFDARPKQKDGHQRTNLRQESDLAKELNDLGSDDEEDKNSDQNRAKLKKILPLLDGKNSNTKTQDKHSTMNSEHRAPKIKTMQGRNQAPEEERKMQKLESLSKAHTSLQNLNVNHRTVLMQRKGIGLDNHDTSGKEFLPHKETIIEQTLRSVDENNRTSNVKDQDTARKTVRKTEKAPGVQPKVAEDRQRMPSPRPMAYAKLRNTKLGHFQNQLAKFSKTAGFKKSHVEHETLRNGTQTRSSHSLNSVKHSHPSEKYKGIKSKSKGRIKIGARPRQKSNNTLKGSKRLDANRSRHKTSFLKAKGKVFLYRGKSTKNTGQTKLLSQEKTVKNATTSPPLGNKQGKKQVAKWSKSEKHRKNNTVLGEDFGEGMSRSSKTENFRKNPSVFGEDDDGSKTISPLHRQVDEGSDLMQFAYLENSGEMSMTIQQTRNHSAHSDVHSFKTKKTAKFTLRRNDRKRHDTAKSRKDTSGQVQLKKDNENHISDEQFSRFNHEKSDGESENRENRTHSVNLAVVGSKLKLHHSVAVGILASRHPTIPTNTRYSIEKDSTVHGRLLVSPQKTTPSQVKFVNLRGASLPERELIPSYPNSFPEAEKVKEQKLNGKTVAKETKLSNEKHNNRSATTDSILAHFLNDGSASDGVEFSVRSSGKHSKGGNKHDSRMQQDDSLDVEDLGDADFDIMMSNDIPHKDPKSADKKSKGKSTKEKDTEEYATSKEKDIVAEDDNDDSKSLKTKNSDHSQRIHKKKASKSKKEAKTPRTFHNKKRKKDDDKTEETIEENLQTTNKYKKHHKDGGDKDKGKENDRTPYDNDKKTYRSGKHRKHYNDNKWVGKIIPGKIKVTHKQEDKGVKKHQEEDKDDEKRERHAEHKEDRTRQKDEHHHKRKRKRLHQSNNSDDNDATEQHEDAQEKKHKRKHGDQEEVDFEKRHKKHEDDHKRAHVKEKHKSHRSHKSKDHEVDKQHTGETRDEEQHEHHKHHDAAAEGDHIKTERETKKSRKHHHLDDHERSGKKRFKGEKQMRDKHRKQNDETDEEPTVVTHENKDLKSRKHHPRNHGDGAEKRTDVNYQVVKKGRHGMHYHEEFSNSGDEAQNNDNDEEDGSNGSEPSDYDSDDDNDDGSDDTSSDDEEYDKDKKDQGRDSKKGRQGSRVVLGEDSDDETEDADGHSWKKHRKHRKMDKDRNVGEKNDESYHSHHQRSHHENHRKSDFRHTHDQRRNRKLRRKHHKSHLRTFKDEEGYEDEVNHIENNRRNFRESVSHRKRYEVHRVPARHRWRESHKKVPVKDLDSFEEDDRRRENDRRGDHHRTSGSYRHHGHHDYSPNEDSEPYYGSERSHEGRRINDNRYKDESHSRDHASHNKYHDENDEDNKESEPDRDQYIRQHGKKHPYQKTQEHLDDEAENGDRSGFKYRDEMQREHGNDQKPLQEEQESLDGGNLRYHKAERERHHHLKDEGGSYEHSFRQDENSQDRGDTRNHEDRDREKDYEQKHETWGRHKENGHKKNRYHFHRNEERGFGEPDGSFDSSAWIFNEGTEDDSFHGEESNHGKHRRRHRKHRQSYEYWRYGQQYPYYNYGTHKQPYRYDSPWPPFGGWQKQQYQENHQWKPSPSSRWYLNNNDNDYRWDKKSPWRLHSQWPTTANPKQETWQKYLDGGQNEETPTPSNTLAPNDWGPTQSTWQQDRATQKGFLSNDWPHNRNLEEGHRHYEDWSSFKSPTPGNNWARPQYMPQHNIAPSSQPWQSYDKIPNENSPAPQGVESKYVPFTHQQNGSEFGSQVSLRPTDHRPLLANVAPQIWTRGNLTKITNIVTTLNQPLLAPSGKQSNVIPLVGQVKPPNTTRNNIGQVGSNQNASRDQDIQRLNGFFNEESGGQKKSGIEKPQTKLNSSSQNVSSSVNGSQRNQFLPAKLTTPLAHLQKPHPANVSTKTIPTVTTPSKTSISHTTRPVNASQENTTTVPTTTTERPPSIQPFGDASQPDESSEEKGNKHRKHRAPICMAGKITDDRTLLRGKRAGNFTSIGDVGDFEMCIKRCCQHKKCNLAFKSAETCFLVHCFSKDSCQTSPSIDDIFSPRMCFVKRSLRDGEGDPDERDGEDDKVSPAGIHEVCEAERAFGILWQKTAAGRSSKHPCPREAKGFVKRRCEADSRWLPPDFSDCISSDYQDLYEKSKRLAVGDDPSPLIRELSMLTTHNIDNSLIFGGDLDRATDIMASIVQHNGQTDLPMNGDDVENFVKASSNLLDMTNQQEWTHLQMEKPGSADVLRSMEMFALQAARRLPREDMTEPTITNNIIIKMDRKSAGDEGLTFPDYSNPKINRWDARHDIIDLPASVFDRGEVSTASISFKSLPYLLPDSNSSTGLGPNSKVISTVLYPHTPEKITPPVTIVLSHIKRRRGNPKCVFWDYTLNPHRGGAWSSQGCWLAFSNQSHSICQCSHLSNFAVLMDLSSDEISQKEQKKERTMALMWIGIPVLIVGVIGALYMSFSWNRKSGIPSTATRPSTSLNEKTGLLGQRVVTSQVREEFPSSPSRDLYRALSPGYSPTSADLEWQDEFDLDMESSDNGFKKILLPRLQLLQKHLINEFYEGDKTEAKKQILESKIQPPLQPKPKRTSRTRTAQPVSRPKMRPASRNLRVRFADESLPRRNLTDDDKQRFKRLQRMERRVFIQHLRRWRANSHLNLSD